MGPGAVVQLGEFAEHRQNPGGWGLERLLRALSRWERVEHEVQSLRYTEFGASNGGQGQAEGWTHPGFGHL